MSKPDPKLEAMELAEHYREENARLRAELDALRPKPSWPLKWPKGGPYGATSKPLRSPAPRTMGFRSDIAAANYQSTADIHTCSTACRCHLGETVRGD